MLRVKFGRNYDLREKITQNELY